MPDIQLKCLAAGFDVDMTELFSTKTMMDLFRLLLSKNKGSFNSIVLLMNEVIPKIVADIHVVGGCVNIAWFEASSSSL